MDVAVRSASFSVGNGRFSIGKSGGSIELATLFHREPTVSDFVLFHNLWKIRHKEARLQGEMTKQLNSRLKAQILEQVWRIRTVVFWFR